MQTTKERFGLVRFVKQTERKKQADARQKLKRKETSKSVTEVEPNLLDAEDDEQVSADVDLIESPYPSYRYDYFSKRLLFFKLYHHSF
jgi:hypothetical protein